MEPLCLTSAHGPYILTGRENHRSKRVLEVKGNAAYQIVAVERGVVEYVERGRRRKLVGPCGLLVPPGDDFLAVLPAGGTWHYLMFDAIHQPRRFLRRTHGPATVHVNGSRSQPSAEKVWGRDLPLEVPADYVGSCIDCVRYANARWWRDAAGYVRANHHLGLWLVDLVEAIGGAPAGQGDWLAWLSEHGRRLLCHGIAVNDLARIAGLSRQQLRLRMIRECGRTPSRFLEDLRLDTVCSLLRSTDMPIAAIARHVGYSCSTVLGRRFRKATNCSPRQWRERQRCRP